MCLAMDVCNGGELFDAIVKKGSYSEVDAASLIRVIVGVVAHCHNMGVIHRDLKVGRALPQHGRHPQGPQGGERAWREPVGHGRGHGHGHGHFTLTV